MSISNDLSNLNSVFIDTAPVIYFIEAHPQFGPFVKEIVNSFQTGEISAYTSVITLTEVLVKPYETGNDKLANDFSSFIRYSSNLHLINLSADIAESAGRLRGKYPFLRTMDALQLAVAINIPVDSFITNDVKLKKVHEINVIVLKDYLS